MISNILQHPKTTVIGILIAITIASPILSSFDFAHASVASICGLAGAVAAALLGAFSKDPKSGAPLGVLLFMLLMPGVVSAQTVPIANPVMPVQPITQPVAAVDVVNLYAAGVSWNSSATPAIAGTGLYARKVADTGTYAFTAIDAVPNTLKPFVVTTNIGAGIAQRLVTIAGVPIYVPTAAGISFSGSNTGWQWNTGALASIKLKGNYFLMPTVRIVKSSVSSGTGYQPIVGVLFGWGQ
jgi:hypothetical protein